MDDVQRVGPLALPHDRPPGGDGPKPDPPGEVAEGLLVQAPEEREPVDQLGGLHPPPGLEPEPRPPPDGPGPSAGGPGRPDPAADRGAPDEQGEGEEQRAAERAPAPEGGHEPAEDDPPEERRGPDREGGEGDPREPVGEQADLAAAEPLPRPELAEEVLAEEGEGPLPEVRHLDQFRGDPVPVELEERDQVHEQHEVVEDAEAVEGRGEWSPREGPHGERGGARRHELGEGSAERLEDPLPPLEHQALRGVHEERGGAEAEHEARALHASAEVDEGEGVPQLVEEREEVAQREQRQGLRDRGGPGEREPPGAVDRGEREEPGPRREDGHRAHRRGVVEATQAVVVEEADQPVRAPPLHREGPDRPPGDAGGAGPRLEGAAERLVHPQRPPVEEALLVEQLDQVGHAREVEVALLAEPLDHDLPDRPGAAVGPRRPAPGRSGAGRPRRPRPDGDGAWRRGRPRGGRRPGGRRTRPRPPSPTPRGRTGRRRRRARVRPRPVGPGRPRRRAGGAPRPPARRGRAPAG